MQLSIVPIEKPPDVNVIIGQAHFIKTVEDLHEELVGSMPGIRFGLAFCEASGPRLVRTSGTDPDLVETARENALTVGCGHSFFVFLSGSFPINVLNAIKGCREVCRIFCATANELRIVVAEDGEQRGILGVLDGHTPRGVENDEDVEQRKSFLRTIGYKL